MALAKYMLKEIRFSFLLMIFILFLYVAGFNTNYYRHGLDGLEKEHDGDYALQNKYKNRKGTESVGLRKMSVDRQTQENFRLVRRSCRKIRICDVTSRSDDDTAHAIPIANRSPITEYGPSPHTLTYLKRNEGKNTSVYNDIIHCIYRITIAVFIVNI